MWVSVSQCVALNKVSFCHCFSTPLLMTDLNEEALKFSLKQYTIVRKVLKSDNHFRILGVTRQASSNTIKRQWKRLSRLVHPDKNAAPGAEEAFKSI